MYEEWRDIAVSNGNYQISNLGRVKSVERKTSDNVRMVHERILKTRINKRGYEYVNIQCNGKRKAIKIHREVAKAFISNPFNYPEVNHKDEVKTNNCVDNLEWCDRIYNANYGTAIKRGAETRMKNHTKLIAQYSINGEFIRQWKSPIDVERRSGKKMRAANIIQCCRGNYKTSYGYTWKYVVNNGVNEVQNVKH